MAQYTEAAETNQPNQGDRLLPLVIREAKASLVVGSLLVAAVCSSAEAAPPATSDAAAVVDETERATGRQQAERVVFQDNESCTVTVTAHRGVVDLPRFDENTPKSARRALQMGADASEYDVALLQKAPGALFRQWVVIHDTTWDRTTDGEGLVDQTLPHQARKLVTGDNSPLPFVPDMIDAVKSAGPEKAQQVEIKNIKLNQGDIDRLVSMVDERDMLDRTTFTATKNRIIRMLRTAAPSVRIGYIHMVADWPNLDRLSPYATDIMVDQSKITPARVKRARAQAIAVSARNVLPKHLPRLLDIGVDNRVGVGAVSNLIVDAVGPVLSRCTQYVPSRTP